MNALRFIERILLVLGLLACGLWSWDQWDLLRFRAEHIQRWSAESHAQQTSLQARATTEPLHRRQPAPGEILGRIDIARVGVRAVLIEGVRAPDLRKGVGHLPDTPLPGRGGPVALAGHRDTHFRGLANIAPGDRVAVTTDDGNWHYNVTSTSVVQPEDVHVLNGRADELVLITCFPFRFVGPAPQRFVVRAERLVEGTQL